MRGTVVGLRIRERRRALGVKQIELAARLGISPSYLNLIEANKRRIGGSLLTRIAAELELRLDQLDGSAERRLIATLSEMAADPEISAPESRVGAAEELIAISPDWARLAAAAYQRLGDATADVARLSDRLAHDPALAAAVHAMLTEISVLRSTSEILYESGGAEDEMDPDQRRRFEAIIYEQSAKLAASGGALAKYFDDAAERRSDQSADNDAEEAILLLETADERIEARAAAASAELSSGGEDLIIAMSRRTDIGAEARELGFLERRDALALSYAARTFDAEIEALIDECDALATRAWRVSDGAAALSEEARARLREELVRRHADALLAPAEALAGRGARAGWDPLALERLADGDAELAMRRATLTAPGKMPPGARIAMATVDASGRILRRRGTLALFARARKLDCPAWPAHSAPRASYVATPVTLRDGEKMLAVARRSPDGMASAMMLFNSEAAQATVFAPQAAGAPVPVGPDCRICAHDDCRWRREPFVAAG